ncbi:MAG: hypothetical protein A2261_02885 [Candidatus Magasanikbacteria bacterium RIFOXYA2_FULL_44_8]|uniref:Uncharacterized protein n=1 Tax=Candidatus Magasanikbacteria bacterium RIFOXYA2_FULL_44_8 TaxID=1798696 RepID=A0A1F6NKE0_9BACT|nr:MAG: hypothetical protein A2261_02885 [Candidatus Magasanikbacteria bacterium RIFOXYA2_FULL_44_8]
MFRHKGEVIASEKNQSEPSVVKDKSVDSKIEEKLPTVKKEFTVQTVGELLEKNLKWSQIIYEQNRRINRKLVWMAVMSWIKVGLVLAVVAVSAWFLPPLLGNVIGQYQSLLGGEIDSGLKAGRNANNQMLEKLFQLLPINSAQQEQIKTILK